MNTEFIEEGPWGRTLVKSLKRVFFLCEQYKKEYLKIRYQDIFSFIDHEMFWKARWHDIKLIDDYV